MKLETALKGATMMAQVLVNACEMVEIAGSVRREKQEVKDIEIICIPTPGEDMFGDPDGYPKLDRCLACLLKDGVLRVDTDVKRQGPKYKRFLMEDDVKRQGPKYKRFLMEDDTVFELFIADAANWGSILLIRTGPWEFSRKCVTQRNKGGLLPNHLCHYQGGVIWGNEAQPTPTEQSFFDILGVPFIEPRDREAWYKEH